MTKNKPEETSSDESPKNRPEPDETSEIEKTWYHESSRTESDALRAMIGKGDKDDATGETEKPAKE